MGHTCWANLLQIDFFSPLHVRQSQRDHAKITIDTAASYGMGYHCRAVYAQRPPHGTQLPKDPRTTLRLFPARRRAYTQTQCCPTVPPPAYDVTQQQCSGWPCVEGGHGKQCCSLTKRRLLLGRVRRPDKRLDRVALASLQAIRSKTMERRITFAASAGLQLNLSCFSPFSSNR